MTKISIYQIQPAEFCLREDSVNYFLRNPDSLFTQEIKILDCRSAQPFKYLVIDGNHRLYACHKLGIKEVEVVNGRKATEIDVRTGLDVLSQNVYGWKDLESRIYPEKEYYERVSKIIQARLK